MTRPCPTLPYHTSPYTPCLYLSYLIEIIIPRHFPYLTFIFLADFTSRDLTLPYLPILPHLSNLTLPSTFYLTFPIYFTFPILPSSSYLIFLIFPYLPHLTLPSQSYISHPILPILPYLPNLTLSSPSYLTFSALPYCI